MEERKPSLSWRGVTAGGKGHNLAIRREGYKGTIFNDMPYAVFSIMGYDKAQKKYFNIHMETLGSGFETSLGICDASCKVFTFTVEGKSTLEIVSNDKNIARGSGKGPDGKQWMILEITATRK